MSASSIRIIEGHIKRLTRPRIAPSYTPDVRGRRDDDEADTNMLVIGGPGPVDVSLAVVAVRVPDAGATEPVEK